MSSKVPMNKFFNEMIAFEELKTPESLAIIRTIAREVWPETFAAILSKEQIIYMMQMMYAPEVMTGELHNGYHFELISVDGEAAGYFSWSPYSLPGTAKLHKLYLRHKFHGRGIGSQMLKQVEFQAKAAGFNRLRLNVNKFNTKARKAYFRNKFSDVESVKIDIGSGFFMDDFVMEKNI